MKLYHEKLNEKIEAARAANLKELAAAQQKLDAAKAKAAESAELLEQDVIANDEPAYLLHHAAKAEADAAIELYNKRIALLESKSNSVELTDKEREQALEKLRDEQAAAYVEFEAIARKAVAELYEGFNAATDIERKCDNMIQMLNGTSAKAYLKHGNAFQFWMNAVRNPYVEVVTGKRIVDIVRGE